MRKYLQRVSMLDGYRKLPVEQEVERLIRDDNPVVGVSYHPGKRKWRAYIYSGGKQIAHAWCSSKREAITARLNMEREHGKPRPPKPGTTFREFPRHVPAPGRRYDATLAIDLLGNRALWVERIVRDAEEGGMRKRVQHGDGKISMRREIGIRVGKMLTVIEQLSMAGELKPEHIEEGMIEMAEELSGKKMD